MLVNNHFPQNNPLSNKTREYNAIHALSIAIDTEKAISTDEDISISFDAQIRLERENNNLLNEYQQTEFLQKSSDNLEKIYAFLHQGLSEQSVDDTENPIYMTYHPNDSSLHISSQNPDIAFHLTSLIESKEGDLFHQLSKETFEHMERLGASQGNHYELSKTNIAAQQTNEYLSLRFNR